MYVRRAPPAALDVLNHQHAEEGSGNSCTVFVCSRRIWIELMGCDVTRTVVCTCTCSSH